MSQSNSTIQTVELNRYNVESVVDFMEATLTVSGNFQAYITDMIRDNQANIMIDYTNAIVDEHDAPEFNKRMSKLRKQISRACESLEMDNYTIKKVDGAFMFVLAKKQAVIEPEAEPANDSETPEGDVDSLETTAARLMAKFMATRSIGDASAVTAFMLNLV